MLEKLEQPLSTSKELIPAVQVFTILELAKGTCSDGLFWYWTLFFSVVMPDPIEKFLSKTHSVHLALKFEWW